MTAIVEADVDGIVVDSAVDVVFVGSAAADEVAVDGVVVVNAVNCAVGGSVVSVVVVVVFMFVAGTVVVVDGADVASGNKNMNHTCIIHQIMILPITSGKATPHVIEKSSIKSYV